MDFLFSSNILIDYPLKKALSIFSAENVAGVEIWLEHLWKENTPSRELGRLMDSLNLKRTLHAPTRDVNLTSSNPGIAKESMRQTLEALEIASKLGAKVVTVHPGRMSSSKDRPEEFFSDQVSKFLKIGETAKQLGLKVGIEVMEKKPAELITTPEELNALLEAVKVDCLGATFDVAHAASCFKNTVTSDLLNEKIIDYMKKLNKIFNVHISNASRVKVHLPLYRGEYDFLPVLRELSKFYAGSVSIEGFVPGEGLKVLRENKIVTQSWKEALADG